MKIHEKAYLYDELLKDHEELLNELEKFKKELEELPNREDLLKLKEENHSHYYAAAVGSFTAMAFALDIKLSRAKGMFNWYKTKK